MDTKTNHDNAMWLNLFLFMQQHVSAEPLPMDGTELLTPYNMPENLWATYEQSENVPLEEKMNRLSQTMMGLPYVLNGIGEGVYPDKDPIFRFDNYDCLSFVEVVLAMSLSANSDEIEKILTDLRYHGDIDYKNRNHFMISQWLPNAIEKGYLKDITKDLGEVKAIHKSISLRNWSKWRGRHAFHLEPEEYPIGDYFLEVLKL